MIRRLKALFTVLCSVGPMGLIVTPPALAQTDIPAHDGSPLSSQEGAQTASPEELEAKLNDRAARTLSSVLARMRSATGIQVVCDSTSGKATVPALAEKTTPENLEAQLAALVRRLPAGTTWAKLMLPVKKGRLDGDAVADYAQAQAKLFGRVGAKTPPDEVEILGERLPSDKAAIHIEGLHLEPVYLITNPSGRVAQTQTNPQQWANLTPEQKREYANRQAAQLAGMDPAVRNAIAQQYMLIFTALMRGLPQEQRQNLLSGMGGPGQPMRVIVRDEVITSPDAVVAPLP